VSIVPIRFQALALNRTELERFRVDRLRLSATRDGMFELNCPNGFLAISFNPRYVIDPSRNCQTDGGIS
jgi:hypothetical protein